MKLTDYCQFTQLAIAKIKSNINLGGDLYEQCQGYAKTCPDIDYETLLTLLLFY